MKIKVKDPIIKKVVNKFVGRSNVGFKKYGKTLMDDNTDLDGWLNHLQEELMDAVNYLERAREEINRGKSDNPWDGLGFVDIIDCDPYEKEDPKKECRWEYKCNCTNKCFGNYDQD